MITLLLHSRPGQTPIGPAKTAEYLATGLFKEVKSVPCDDPPGFRKDECVAYFQYLVDYWGNYPDLVMFMQSDPEEHLYVVRICCSPSNKGTEQLVEVMQEDV